MCIYRSATFCSGYGSCKTRGVDYQGHGNLSQIYINNMLFCYMSVYVLQRSAPGREAAKQGGVDDQGHGKLFVMDRCVTCCFVICLYMC